MKTTEMVMDFLRKQGFCPEVLENGNIVFKYQMATFLFVDNASDEEFFQLLMPQIYDVTEENRGVVLEAMNQTNTTMKVVKTTIINDGVWVMFEILLDSTPNISDIIPRALQILEGARRNFYENLS